MKCFEDLKKDLVAYLGFVGLLLLFYPELFLAKAAPLVADHWEQHYPWAFWFAESLKHGKLPFWTSLIQCGFPLAAESQLGLFYLPNLTLLFILPIQWAYSYMSLVHWLIVAVGTYLYCRHMGLQRLSSFLAAFVFVFGSGYGGAYYNINSLKTIAWFPLLLFWFEKFYRNLKWRYLILMTCVIFQMIVAGYMQVALLTLFIVLIYMFIRLFLFANEDRKSPWFLFSSVSKLIVTFFAALLLALPQMILTFQLAALSNRAGVAEEYAYVGSMSPAVLATLWNPFIQTLFRGNCLYLGILAVFLICVAFFNRGRKFDKLFWLWIGVGLIALLFSLGEWSPVYILFVKITHFYSFRIPSKFLIFICFALSMIVGIGFERIWEAAKNKESLDVAITRPIYLFMGSTILVILGTLLFQFLITQGSLLLIKIGHWIIDHFVYGRAGHPHSLTVYQDKLVLYLDFAKRFFSFQNPWTLWEYFILSVGVVFAYLLLFLKKLDRRCVIAILLVFFLDLYVFAFFDVKSDFNSYSNVVKSSLVLEKLKEEKESDHIKRLYGFRPSREPLALIPSANMLYEIEDIGIYSPLVLKRYYESIGQLGDVDDSNFSMSPTKEFVLERESLLLGLGVSHILAKEPLNFKNYKLISLDSEQRDYLYRAKKEVSTAFFVTQFRTLSDWGAVKEEFMAPGFVPSDQLLLEVVEAQKVKFPEKFLQSKAQALLECQGYNEEKQVWKIQTNQPGFFVLMNTMYPGWKAKINGKASPILLAYGLFQSLWIDHPGEYTIELEFHPFQK